MHYDLVLGVVEVDVPPVMAWGACVTLTSVFSKFLSYCKVGNKFVAWPYFPHNAHGGVTIIVCVSCMRGASNICWVAPLVLVLVVLDEDPGARLVVARAFNLGWLMPP